MNLENLSRGAARQSAANRALHERHALLDAPHRELEEMPFTVDDGIRSLSDVIRKEPKNSRITQLLTQYRSRLVEYQTAESLIGSRHGRIRLIDLPDGHSASTATDICVANYYQKNGDSAPVRISGSHLLREIKISVALFSREIAVSEAARDRCLTDPEESARARSALQNLLPRVAQFEQLPLEDLPTLVDDLTAFNLRYGFAERRSRAFDHESDLLKNRKQLLHSYGFLVVDGLLDRFAEATPLTAGRHAADPVERVQRMRNQNELLESFLSLQERPTIEALSRHSQKLEKCLVEACFSHSLGPAAEYHLGLDVESKTFGVSMQRIAEQQRLDLRRDRELASLLAEAETASSSKPCPMRKPSNMKKPSKAKKRASLPQAAEAPPTGTDAAVALSDAEQEMRRRITAAAKSSRNAVVLEGEVASMIVRNLSAFANVIGFNQKFARDSKNLLGEIDVHLDQAIVECTLRSSGKEAQLRKYLSDRSMNPQRKPVILYGENYRSAVPHGVIHVRSSEELGDALFALTAEKYGWLGKASETRSAEESR